MAPLRSVCVFCGSRSGIRPHITEVAARLGATLAERNIGLVYGGASVGLMGVVADAALEAGGRVTGVITESLADHEIAHQGLAQLEVVHTMHERKARMAELSDAFIMLPGGFGTYEEFMEAVTWVQLGIHDKPCGILNIDAFFDDLLKFVSLAVELEFIQPQLAGRIVVDADLEVLLTGLTNVNQPDS
jgi:uncharacterized protein (TIGR00730 family)